MQNRTFGLPVIGRCLNGSQMAVFCGFHPTTSRHIPEYPSPLDIQIPVQGYSFLLAEVDGVGSGAAAESIKRALEAVEVEIRRRLS